METNQLLLHIRQQIAEDNIRDSIVLLQQLLLNSPRLNEVLLHSARHEGITKQIRLGIIDWENAELEKNKIRLGLLDLLQEVEKQTKEPKTREELTRATQKVVKDFNLITHSKNVVVNSNFDKGSNVRIGDDYIQTESTFSQRLRFTLYILVPLLTILAAYFWYYYNVLKQPLNLKVLLENMTPNPELAGPSGELTLIYGGKTESKAAIKDEAIFESIPSSFKDEFVRLKYLAKGFLPVDTTFRLGNSIHLPVRRNEDLALIKGFISDESGAPLNEVEVSIPCCSTLTDPSGTFMLSIPFKHQRNSQRLNIFKASYQAKDLNTPVIPGEVLRIILTKK